MKGPLGLDDETLAACVACGLCLPHCPTWRATGEEIRSPRGRIGAMREVQWHDAPLDAGFVEAIESCVGCRACDTACPSGVHYGEMLEATTRALVGRDGPAQFRWWYKRVFALLDKPRLLRVGVVLTAVLQRLGLDGRGPLRNMPRLPLHQVKIESTGEDVVLLTGCVMDATQRRVHAAAISVLGAAGFGVGLQPAPGCCGALAGHAGFRQLADDQLATLAESLPPRVTVISDSAGCGAAILEAGRRADAPEALQELSRRTFDINSFLASQLDRLPEPAADQPKRTVVVSQPCHLRNVQGAAASKAILELLGRYFEVRSTDDDDLCCGAGGSYSLLRPAEAASIRDAKIASLARSGATLVATANPGCSLHLAAGGVITFNPVELLDHLFIEMSAATATVAELDHQSGIPISKRP